MGLVACGDLPGIVANVANVAKHGQGQKLHVQFGYFLSMSVNTSFILWYLIKLN